MYFLIRNFYWAILILIGSVNSHYWIAILNLLFSLLYHRMLVHRFDHRWRWCCGHFNFRQKTLEIGYHRSIATQNFCYILGVDFFITLGQTKPNIYSVFTEL